MCVHVNGGSLCVIVCACMCVIDLCVSEYVHKCACMWRLCVVFPCMRVRVCGESLCVRVCSCICLYVEDLLQMAHGPIIQHHQPAC